jgi:hypothetical protein
MSLVARSGEFAGDLAEQARQIRATALTAVMDGNSDTGGMRPYSMAVAPDSSLTKRAIEVLIFRHSLSLGYSVAPTPHWLAGRWNLARKLAASR